MISNGNFFTNVWHIWNNNSLTTIPVSLIIGEFNIQMIVWPNFEVLLNGAPTHQHPSKSTPRPARIPTTIHYACHPLPADQSDPSRPAHLCPYLPKLTYTHPYTCAHTHTQPLYVSPIVGGSVWTIQTCPPLPTFANICPNLPTPCS